MGELIPLVGARRACELTGRSRASHCRHAKGPVHGPPAPRPAPANKLTDEEVDALVAVMNSPEFVKLAPAQIWAILLDNGIPEGAGFVKTVSAARPTQFGPFVPVCGGRGL